MNIRSSIKKPSPYRGQTAVSAYIDGKSATIEAMKLNAVDRFDSAREQFSDESLKITIDGQRHSRVKDLAIFTGMGVLPTIASSILGHHLAGTVGAVVGGVAGFTIAGLPSTFFLNRALKAPDWQAESRLELGKSAQPSPVTQAGPDRLRSLVEDNRSKYPEARQMLFLSGHGDRTEVAHMDIPEMGKVMRGTKLDATVLDSCLTGQLEVLTHLAPWAGFVMTSPHKIKARGMELTEIFHPQHLEQANLKDAVVGMAAEAKSTTPSFAVIDTAEFQKSFLPALDTLGRALSTLDREKVREVIRESKGTDGLLSKRIDMGSFLKNLSEAELAPDEAKAALESFQQTVPFQKNEHSFSFHLEAGKNDRSIPAGWREFLTSAELSRKPIKWGL